MPAEPAPGTIIWSDLTIADAPRLANFYHAVVGWEPQALPECDGDFNMNLPGTQTTIAGVCHARGPNASLPPQWLIYVRVKNINDSIEACKKLGGKVLGPVAGSGVVIQDPAGAVMALLPSQATEPAA